ncbi:MAG TPA: DUF5667 domain-containing protein [Candidatus Methanoperedens sp.]
MKMRIVTLAGMILLAVILPISIAAANADKASGDGASLVGNVEPNKGLIEIAPDNPFYELVLAWERIDVTFTPGESEKLRKQIEHLERRLAEANAEFNKKKTEAANKALEHYLEEATDVDAKIAGYKGTDTGILNARNETRKHQIVLHDLLESHPNNTGLARAYDNSLKLEEKFRHKIEEREERESRDHKEEQLKINAEVIGNATNVKVNLEFETNSTDNSTIAQEILDKLQLSTGNISDILKLEEDEKEDEEHTTPTPTVAVTGTTTTTLTVTPTPEIDEDSKEKLTVRAEIENNISDVKFEYKFQLDVTNRTEIVEGIYQKLSALNLSEVLNVLEIKVKEEKVRQNKVEKGSEVTKVAKNEKSENMGRTGKQNNKEED